MVCIDYPAVKSHKNAKLRQKIYVDRMFTSNRSKAESFINQNSTLDQCDLQGKESVHY